MQNDHPAEEDLVMLYYRESDSRPDQLRDHLAECPSCRTAYEQLTRVLDACNDLPVPEPHVAFESRMWNRLEPQLPPLNQKVNPWALFRTRRFAAAAVAAMLIAAFLAGRFTRPPARPTTIVAITADGRQRVLLMALGDHLERSEMVLTELANGPDETESGASGPASGVAANPAAGRSVELERVRNLISENRLYRQTAAESGDPAVAAVLDELERVLLDISHGTDAREIKSRIDSESLLFKLRVLGSNLKPSQETL